VRTLRQRSGNVGFDQSSFHFIPPIVREMIVLSRNRA
jgi:hypothetical protein